VAVVMLGVAADPSVDGLAGGEPSAAGDTAGEATVTGEAASAPGVPLEAGVAAGDAGWVVALPEGAWVAAGAWSDELVASGSSSSSPQATNTSAAKSRTARSIGRWTNASETRHRGITVLPSKTALRNRA